MKFLTIHNLLPMKKLIVIVALALAAFTANAQVYVGGGVNFLAAGGGTALVQVSPDFGYILSSNTAVGARLSFDNLNGGTSFDFNPYYRYGFKQFGKVMLFADAELDLLFNNFGGTSTTTFGIGLAPGLLMQLNDHISLYGILGRVGYYGAFMVNVSTAPRIGFYYHF